LISDILFNAGKVTHAWSYKREFELQLPNLFLSLNRVFKTDLNDKKMSKNELKNTVKKLLALWKEKSVLEEKVIDGLECTFELDKSRCYSLNIKDGFFQPVKESLEET
jgi:hypothetical protein